MTNVPDPPPLAPLLAQSDSFGNNRLVTDQIEKNEHDCACPFNYQEIEKKTVTEIKPIAQNGPNCGIAALAMVSSLTPTPLSLDDIFNEANSRGFTINGEMFSVQNMQALARTILSPSFSVELFSNGLKKNKLHVINSLYSGDLMLIPYDADMNHSPCCLKGHKAHWALVCGVATYVGGEVSVLARHGKSRRLAAWPLEQLWLSNDQLTELGPARKSDSRTYAVPEGGLRAGLASQFILLSKAQRK